MVYPPACKPYGLEAEPEANIPSFHVGATAQELSLVYEKAPGGLKVLPSFCVVPAIRAFPKLGNDLVNGPLKGDVNRFKEFKARFSSVVYPGDTISTEGWKTDGGYIIQAKTENNIVLNNARAVVE